MKIELLWEHDKIALTTTEIILPGRLYDIGKLLDHARLKKDDVSYDQSKGTFVIKMKRYNLLRRLIGHFIWINSIVPQIECVLTIRDIAKCEIWDEDPRNPHRNEVIIGRLIIENENKIFLGAFCEHENPFHIIINTNRVNMTLEDV